MMPDEAITELTFSYVFDCLQSFTEGDQFLGFTLSNEAAERHKNQINNLSELKNYFAAELLNAIILFHVPNQTVPVLKWTDKTAMENYLKAHGTEVTL